MITTFGDKATARIFQGKFVHSLPLHMQALAHRKLLMIDAASSIHSLHAPPGNRLEALQGARAGSFSIGVNDQYRITFRFEGEHAHDVRCEDYH